MFSAGEMLKRN